MQQYRLLRNNKETGPYQYQDLIDLPLKAYDLVWVEGKSAAWRYPSEIEELAPWSPPALENLYYRLHPNMENSFNTSKQQTPITVKDGTVKARRYVSVIYPLANTAKAEPAVPEESTIEWKSEELSVANNQNDSPESQQVSRFYVASAFLILLAGGIYFGTSDHPFSKAVRSAPIENATGMIMQTSTNLHEEKITSEKITNKAEEKENLKADPLEVIPAKKNNTPPLSISSNPSLNFAALQRYVDLRPQKFHVGLFGGISNLSLNIRNTGQDPLTDIIVAVDFIQKNKAIHHTEHVKIPSLDANESITVSVPESQFGVAIRTRVIGVNGISKQ